MTVQTFLNACNNVNLETRVIIENRKSRIYVGNELNIPEYILSMNVNSFYIDNVLNQIIILIYK